MRLVALLVVTFVLHALGFAFSGTRRPTLSGARTLSLSAAGVALSDEFIKKNVANEGDLRVSATGRAKVAIKKGELLASVPLGLCLDAAKAKVVFSTSAKTLSMLRTGDFGLIALLLLHEKSLGKASKWSEYIVSLPDMAPGVLSWSQTELDELVVSSTRDFASQIAAVKDDWQLISRLPELTFVDEEAFKWAVGTVKARNVFIENQPVLVPIIDVMPFDPFSEAEPTVGSAGMFGGKIVKVLADNSYNAGDEVFISYGLKSSAECVEDHGFCPDVPLVDACCELKVGLDETDRFVDDKIEILEQQGLDKSVRVDIEAAPNAQLDKQLLQVLRLKCIEKTDSFILESVFSNTVWKTLTLPFSKANELKVYATLGDKLRGHLATINSKSSAEQDANILEETSAPSPSVTLARLRSQERAALQGALANIEATVRVLMAADTTEYYQERRLRELDLLRPLDEDEIVTDG